VPNPLLDPPPPVQPLAYRPRDAAKALGVSERTLWTWTKRGDVPHARIGGRLLYPVAVLERWLSKKAAAQADPEAKGGEL